MSRAAWDQLEHQMAAVLHLLEQSDPDPAVVTAEIQNAMSAFDALVAIPQQDEAPDAVVRVEALRVAVVDAARAQRERLFKALATLDHAAQAIRRYAPNHNSSARFIDHRG